MVRDWLGLDLGLLGKELEIELWSQCSIFA